MTRSSCEAWAGCWLLSTVRLCSPDFHLCRCRHCQQHSATTPRIPSQMASSQCRWKTSLAYAPEAPMRTSCPWDPWPVAQWCWRQDLLEVIRHLVEVLCKSVVRTTSATETAHTLIFLTCENPVPMQCCWVISAFFRMDALVGGCEQTLDGCGHAMGLWLQVSVGQLQQISIEKRADNVAVEPGDLDTDGTKTPGVMLKTGKSCWYRVLICIRLAPTRWSLLDGGSISRAVLSLYESTSSNR